MVSSETVRDFHLFTFSFQQRCKGIPSRRRHACVLCFLALCSTIAGKNRCDNGKTDVETSTLLLQDQSSSGNQGPRQSVAALTALTSGFNTSSGRTCSLQVVSHVLDLLT
ncbi:unnamed protein product [Arabidopsis arenosa]|uniref:Uncharacterized protein n=1 Tax=Arabidopsis arenosa TaxID=38785 RepID=A0A8S2AFH2_ARAAE|nr:unnamed protein product [Arabidopsis arenosa]